MSQLVQPLPVEIRKSSHASSNLVAVENCALRESARCSTRRQMQVSPNAIERCRRTGGGRACVCADEAVPAVAVGLSRDLFETALAAVGQNAALCNPGTTSEREKGQRQAQAVSRVRVLSCASLVALLACAHRFALPDLAEHEFATVSVAGDASEVALAAHPAELILPLVVHLPLPTI